MWSDRTPPERLRSLTARLHSALPPPRASSCARHELHANASIEQVAELLHPEPGFIWLNSGKSGPLLLRQPLAEISYTRGCAVVSGPQGTVTIPGRGFEILEAALHAWKGAPGAVLAGFLSYDLAAEIEDLGEPPPGDLDFPKIHFGLYDSALVFENGRWIIEGTDAWRGRDGLPCPAEPAGELLRAAEQIAIPSLGESLPREVPASRPDRAGFEASVARIVRTIHAGDIFQTNLCRRLEVPLPPGAGAAWELHRRLRSISPAQYEAFVNMPGGRTLLSISPERFLKVDAGPRTVESSPIKGTRPRGRGDDDDRALSHDLQSSEKDRAELAMIVDVTRNDLARVCEPGTVEVIRHASLMSLPTVHHLFSTVRGRLRDDAGTADLLRAAFPAASITGAPKIEAMRIAMREEGQLRGPAMGAIGWIGLDGSLELSVAIRTAFVTGGRVRYYAGCGITSGSIPAQEYEESRHKAAAFLRALGLEDESA